MSLHFSVIAPADGRERDAALERARGAYADHQWLWTFFPAPAKSARDFQFRRSDVEGMPRIYTLAPRAPVAPSPNWRVLSKPFAPVLHTGQRLRFELRANPVVTSRTDDGKAVRHDVVMGEKKRLLQERGLTRWDDWQGPDRPPLPALVHRTCTDWLLARSARLGFEVDVEQLSVEGYTQHRGKRGEIQFSSVDYAGELTVLDPAACNATLATGIGHAKAFGCGLLLIRPLG